MHTVWSVNRFRGMKLALVISWYAQQHYRNCVNNKKQNSSERKETAAEHRSHTLGQKQPKKMGHTQQVSVEKRTRGMKGEEKKRKERCSPWECSSITERLRPALSHCHSDATSTPPERSPSTSLYCFKHKHTHTHTICAFTQMQIDTLPSVAPLLTSYCCSRTDANRHWYADT